MDGGARRYWVGVDVGGPAKGQAVAVLDDQRRVVHLAAGLAAEGLAQGLVERWGNDLVVGIDASRRPAPAGLVPATGEPLPPAAGVIAGFVGRGGGGGARSGRDQADHG